MPVPITRRLHSQGISSLSETGVCPNCSRNSREGFFFRLRISPPSRTRSCLYFLPSILTPPKRHLPHFMAFSSLGSNRPELLFPPDQSSEGKLPIEVVIVIRFSKF